MLLEEINENTNFAHFANDILNFGLMGKYSISQRFNDKDTEKSLLQTYKSWGLIGHNGLDLVTRNTRNQILSPVDGVVIFADWWHKYPNSDIKFLRGGGIITILKDSNSLLHIFMHLSENVKINLWQNIKAGDSIGTMGGSGFGMFDFPVHCHYQIVQSNSTNRFLHTNNGFFGGIDPLEFVKKQKLIQNELNQDMAIKNNLYKTIDDINFNRFGDDKLNLFLKEAVTHNNWTGLLEYAGSKSREEKEELVKLISGYQARIGDLENLAKKLSEIKKNEEKNQEQKKQPQITSDLAIISTLDDKIPLNEVKTLENEENKVKTEITQTVEKFSLNKFFVGLSKAGILQNVLTTLPILIGYSQNPQFAVFVDKFPILATVFAILPSIYSFLLLIFKK